MHAISLYPPYYTTSTVLLYSTVLYDEPVNAYCKKCPVCAKQSWWKHLRSLQPCNSATLFAQLPPSTGFQLLLHHPEMLSLAVGSLAFHAGSPMLASTSARAVVSMGPAVPSVGSFVYGPPVTLSSGYSRAGTPNSPCSFKVEDFDGKVVPTASVKAEPKAELKAEPKAEPKALTAIGNELCYGAPVPASKGLPGFSWPTSFTAQ